jgi:hypothetical protein
MGMSIDDKHDMAGRPLVDSPLFEVLPVVGAQRLVKFGLNQNKKFYKQR